MIARKIIYTGSFDRKSAELMFSIVSQLEMTGEVRFKSKATIELFLEGDLANITLIQHQIKDRLQNKILDRKVEKIPYQDFKGVALI